MCSLTGVTRARRFFATLAVALAGAGAALAGEPPDDLDVAMAVSRAQARAAALARASTVAIRCERPDGFGAGIAVREDGFVLTALHVVDGAARILVTPAGGEEIRAEIFARDASVDLALLRLAGGGGALHACTFAAGEAEPGEIVLALGNPFGLQGSVSRGVIAASGRRNVIPGNVAPLLQTDAAINPGSSGGPLVNLRGEVVGIVNAIFTRTGACEGVAFAVPSVEIAGLLPSLLAGRRPERPWIGVELSIHAGRQGGLEVLSLEAGGPAEEAGLRAGDILETVDGAPVRGTADLRGALRRAGVGGSICLRVRRGRESLPVSVAVSSVP